MKIESIEIKSFRSISKAKFHLDKIGLLVGPNDSGKSNILRALEMFFDFSANTEESDVSIITGRNKTEIALTFSDLTTTEKNDFKKWSREKELSKLSIRKICIPGKQPVYRDRNSNMQIKPKIIQKHLKGKFLLVRGLRDATQEFAYKEQRLFAEILRVALGRLSSNVIGGMERDLTDGLSRLNKKLNNLVAGTINKCFANNASSVAIGLKRASDTLLNNFELKLPLGTAETSVASHGQGIQSLLVIAVCEAISEMTGKKPILYAIEEPENHLHPSLLLSFITYILRISAQKQILLTTHSPIVAHRLPIESYIRVQKDDENKTVCIPYKLRPQSLGVRFKHQKLLDPIKSELLFASKVVLCEGETEYFMLPLLSARFGQQYDFICDNIVCIHCGGEAFESYVKILNALHIPWILLCDNDFWKSGKWNKMALEFCLDRISKRRFNRIKPNSGVAFSKVASDLEKSFATVCLNSSIEDLILGDSETTLKEVANLLHICRPNSYKTTMGKKRKPNRELLLEIMKKSKTVWARAIGAGISEDKVSENLKNLLIKLKKTKPVNFNKIRK